MFSLNISSSRSYGVLFPFLTTIETLLPHPLFSYHFHVNYRRSDLITTYHTFITSTTSPPIYLLVSLAREHSKTLFLTSIYLRYLSNIKYACSRVARGSRKIGGIWRCSKTTRILPFSIRHQAKQISSGATRIPLLPSKHRL